VKDQWVDWRTSSRSSADKVAMNDPLSISPATLVCVVSIAAALSWAR
jgi:hypothetical protein